MKKFDTTSWTIILSGLILLLLVSLFVIKPLLYDIFEKYQELSLADIKLEKIKKEKEQAENIYKNKSEIENLYTKISTFLPKNLESGDFVVQIEDIAQKTNQNQLEISFAKSDDKKPTQQNEENTSQQKNLPTNNKNSESDIKKQSFSITQNGNFLGLVEFLSKMEKMSRLNIIDLLSISVNNDNILETNIKGQIYYKPNITFSATSFEITPEEKKTVEGLEHFGEIILPSEPSYPSGRTDPFISL